MGTRGTVRIIINGKIICIYVHFDSYPYGLGISLLRELIFLLKRFTVSELKEDFFEIKQNSRKPARPNKKYTLLIMTNRSLNSWYGLTESQYISEAKHRQGSLVQILVHGRVDEMGMHEEYNYIIDFDSNKFECKEVKWNIDLNINSLHDHLTIIKKEMRDYYDILESEPEPEPEPESEGDDAEL